MKDIKINYKLIPITLFLVILSFFTIFFIFRGDLRNYILFFLIITLSINFFFGEKIIFALLIVAPFLGFLRRLMYLFGPYVRLDIFNILSDIFVLMFFLFIILVKRKELLKNLKESLIVKLFSFLFLIMILQIFNPLQGSIIVGLGGAKFWIIPMLWFYFALLIDTEKKFQNILIIIMIIGVISSIYGIKQAFWGFTKFELIWIRSKMEIEKFGSIAVLSFIRPISIFPSPQEYANYLLIAFLIASGLFLKKIRLSVYFFTMILIFFAAITEGIRGIILMIFLGFLFQCFIYVKDKKLAFFIAFFFILMYILFISTISITSIYHVLPVNISRMYYHVLKGIFDPFARESTIWERIMEFGHIPLISIKYPLGLGLGTTSLAGWKFGGNIIGFEVPFFSFIATSSIIGGIIYFIIIVLSLKECYKNYNKTGSPLYVISFSIILTYFIVGGLTLYSTTPIYWFTLGLAVEKNLN
uniref:O-antigen ligase domain-containing protein n=1 Tax=candidate division WOR-3 bacterium TaxID=2052148 RepID=A0A7C4U6Y1_UNCW3